MNDTNNNNNEKIFTPADYGYEEDELLVDLSSREVDTAQAWSMILDEEEFENLIKAEKVTPSELGYKDTDLLMNSVGSGSIDTAKNWCDEFYAQELNDLIQVDEEGNEIK